MLDLFKYTRTAPVEFVLVCLLLTLNSFNVINAANIYLFKINNRNTRLRYEIYSKLTIETPEQLH